MLDNNAKLSADQFVEGAPSALFDAVMIAPSEKGCAELLRKAAAVDWLRMAFAHLKVIGYTTEALPLFEAGRIDPHADEGLVPVKAGKLGEFVEQAKRHRIWEREVQVR